VTHASVLEHAMLEVRPGQEQAFEAAFAKAQAIIGASPGYRSHRLEHCVEHPNRYLLLVEWDSFEAHTVGFRGSAPYQEWKALLHHFYDPFPTVLHFRTVYSSSDAPDAIDA
jgi:heme-degrading monooxygenase HmoA